MKRNRHILKLVIFYTVGISLYLFINAGSSAVAQTDGTEWTTPVNLSQSGAATELLAVEDNNGVIHVLWKDEFAGFVYTRSEGEGWHTPTPVDLPFIAELTPAQQSAGVVAELFMPHMRTDTSGQIHAFWTNQAGALLYSSVPAGAFNTASAWTNVQSLAGGVLAVDIAVDDRDSLHLSYIRSQDTEDLPSGVYYRRSDDGGATWTPSALLDRSAYFRSLLPEKANVSVATSTVGEMGRVYVVWDNPPRERVFVTQSNDNGQTWGAPTEVDRRQAEDSETAVGPSNILVAASGSQVHLIWQAGHQGAVCTQYHQWSLDGGDSWELPQPMLAESGVCPGSNTFLVGENGRLLLLAIVEDFVQGGVYLLAWDGARWSEAQVQEPLSRFVAPDTYRPVDLGCLEALLLGEQLLVLGCSIGNVRDVWMMRRPLGDITDWFPPPPVWQPSRVLVTSAAEILPPLAVSDAEGQVHVLWSETSSAVINYVLWDQLRWSRSLPVLTSPTGTINRLAATVTANGRLLVAWSDGQSGQLYFSQSDVARALFADDWLTPQQLPVPQDGASSPDILIDANGVIYVAYAVPINEERGIYVMRSNDLGETWSEPAKVFDGVAADWTMVDRPQLAVTGREHLHLLWTHYSLPPGASPRALAYAQSSDGGQSWSDASIVTETPVVWSQILGIGERHVHRAWAEQVVVGTVLSSRTTLWHEESRDGGLTWNPSVLVSNLSDTDGPIRLVADAADQLQLVLVSAAGETSANQPLLQLQQWLWQEDRWLVTDRHKLSAGTTTDFDSLAAAVTSDGQLAVVYVARVMNRLSGSENVQELNTLFFSHRLLDLPAIARPPLPTLTPTPTSTPLPTSTPSPSPTPALTFPTEREQGNRLLLDSSSLTGSLLAAIPAGLIIVLAIFFLGWRAARNGQR